MTQQLYIYLSLFALLYIVVLAFILKRQGSANTNLIEFFVSGRNLGIGTAIATLGATEIGLITIAYNAQKGFNEGFSAFHIGLAALIGCVFIGLTGFVVRPLRRTGVLTVPEFYELRFGRDVRIFGAIVMALGGILNMGLFLKVASLFIAAMLNIPNASSSANVIMIVLIVISVAYTSYGGMRSVITTDIFQFVLLTTGLLLGVIYLNGILPFETIVSVVEQNKSASGFDPLINPNFGITYFFWMIVVAGIVSAAIWPTALSRALCIEKEETVPKAYLAASVIFLSRMIIPAFLGVFAFAYFNSPELSGSLAQETLLKPFGTDADLVAMPIMLRVTLPPWLLGFMTVAMIATFMSTQDSYLFCWSSIIARDILGPITGKTDNTKFQILATRASIVGIACYELYWGLVYQGGEDIWDYLTVSGSIYFCSGIVLLTGGLYWRRATRRGALLALIFGFTALLSLGPLKTALGITWSNSEIGFSAIVLALVGFILGSLSEAPSPHRRET